MKIVNLIYDPKHDNFQPFYPAHPVMQVHIPGGLVCPLQFSYIASDTRYKVYAPDYYRDYLEHKLTKDFVKND